MKYSIYKESWIPCVNKNYYCRHQRTNRNCLFRGCLLVNLQQYTFNNKNVFNSVDSTPCRWWWMFCIKSRIFHRQTQTKFLENPQIFVQEDLCSGESVKRISVNGNWKAMPKHSSMEVWMAKAFFSSHKQSILVFAPQYLFFYTIFLSWIFRYRNTSIQTMTNKHICAELSSEEWEKNNKEKEIKGINKMLIVTRFHYYSCTSTHLLR